MLAPIVLFTYKRLSHTKRTIEALANNILASETELYIYSDGFKNSEDKKSVLELRHYLKTIKGFKSISIVEHDTNIGLANSIISGVTNIINKHGKIIVLEDDIVTSSYFLTFMNDALNYYENNTKVWHISGWNYPMKIDDLDDTFMWRMMNCWGWATWQNRWQYFEKNPKNLINTFSDYEIYKYNVDDTENRWKNEILANNNGTLNTWAAFWYATIFKKNGLCVHPSQTFVENIGMDGTGENNGLRYDTFSSTLCNKKLNLTDKIYENDLALYRIKRFFNTQRNNNYIFSININILIDKLNILTKKNEKYVLYGAGRGSELILNIMKNNVKYIIDNDNKKYHTQLKGIDILPISSISVKEKIIISVFGRENEIAKSLIENHNIPKEQILVFDFINHHCD